MNITHPFLDADGDKLREECGIFGVIGVGDAANFVALGLHALQHRGQEAGGIVSYDANSGFNSARRFGYVRDNFTKADVMATLPGPLCRIGPDEMPGLRSRLDQAPIFKVAQGLNHG
jgi:amidophosphoribosyltransferase